MEPESAAEIVSKTGTIRFMSAPAGVMATRRLRRTEASSPAKVAGQTVEAPLGPEARALGAGLVLRAGEPVYILDVGWYSIEYGPAISHHRLIHQCRTDPDIGQLPAVAIGGSNVGFQPHCRLGGHELEQRLPGSLTVRMLLGLGAVDADEANPAAVGAAEGVAVGDASHDASVMGPGLLLPRGT